MLMMDDLQYDIDDHLSFFYIDFKRNPAGSFYFSKMFHLPVNPPFVCHSNIKAVCSLCFCRRHKNPIPTSSLRKESRQDKGKKKDFLAACHFFVTFARGITLDDICLGDFELSTPLGSMMIPASLSHN